MILITEMVVEIITADYKILIVSVKICFESIEHTTIAIATKVD